MARRATIQLKVHGQIVQSEGRVYGQPRHYWRARRAPTHPAVAIVGAARLGADPITRRAAQTAAFERELHAGCSFVTGLSTWPAPNHCYRRVA
jgi:hypothetical protein